MQLANPCAHWDGFGAFLQEQLLQRARKAKSPNQEIRRVQSPMCAGSVVETDVVNAGPLVTPVMIDFPNLMITNEMVKVQ